MIRQRLYYCILFLAALVCPASAQPPAADTSVGHWIDLFDGSTLFGWHATSDADWSVQDGAITVTGGEPGFLMTNAQFGDFELELEFAAPAETNSGVFVRSAAEPQDPAADCLEINIAPVSHPFPTGSIVARQRANRIPARTTTPGDRCRSAPMATGSKCPSTGEQVGLLSGDRPVAWPSCPAAQFGARAIPPHPPAAAEDAINIQRPRHDRLADAPGNAGRVYRGKR